MSWCRCRCRRALKIGPIAQGLCFLWLHQLLWPGATRPRHRRCHPHLNDGEHPTLAYHSSVHSGAHSGTLPGCTTYMTYGISMVPSIVFAIISSTQAGIKPRKGLLRACVSPTSSTGRHGISDMGDAAMTIRRSTRQGKERNDKRSFQKEWANPYR